MEPRREEHRGHRIELRGPEADVGTARGMAEAEPVLLIDDLPVGYGRLADGQYFLEEYAYDWRDDLIDLARRYIDHKADAAEIASERRRGGG